MSQELGKNLYLLLDSGDKPLARGVLESVPGAVNLQVRVLEGGISAVMEHEDLRLVPMADDQEALLGRILRGEGDQIFLKKLQQLGIEMRQNLRISIHAQSFIYPLTKSWRGRQEIETNDISCGGISFFCGKELRDGEAVEVVIPITPQPMVLRCKILRRRPSNREEILYAAKFEGLCNDEEERMREAVFSVQLRSRASR